MRILVVANLEPNSGGVALHIEYLVAAMRDEGVDVDILWRTPLARRLPGSLSGVAFGLAALWRTYRTSPDLVHAHCADGYALRPASRVPYVMTSHGDERPSLTIGSKSRDGLDGNSKTRVGPRHTVNLWVHAVSRRVRSLRFSRAVHSADAVIALHQEEAEIYLGDRGPRNRVYVIPNGSEYRRQPLPIKVGRIIFVGNWLERKGVRLLPLILRRVRSAVPNSELVLVGPTGDVLASFDQVDQPSVSALGWLPRHEVETQLSMANCLVVPSENEGMPLAVLDAIACGVPVIGSELPGIAMAAGAGSLLFRPEDWQSMSDAIIRVIRDGALSQSLSVAAAEHSVNFRWRAIAKTTLGVYATVLGLPA